MLPLVRRLIKSRIGKFVALAFLVMIAIAFAASDISGVRSGSASGSEVAEVGGAAITDRELNDRVRQEMDVVRQRNPQVDVAQFVAAGGVENVLERVISTFALQMFGERADMVVSNRVIDGEIASIPAFQGFNGKFDQATFERRIAERNLTPAKLREDIGRDMMVQWLINPTVGASQMPEQLALPYASLLLEQRTGQVAVIPTSAAPAGTPPTDAELNQFYARNQARFTVPQRRSIRYALVTPASMAAQTAPTDAEIAQAYRAAGSRFAGAERRTVQQVVVADQAAANRLAQQVRGGTTLETAARAAGLEPSRFQDLEKTALATQASAAVSDAAFATAQGAVAGPVRSPLGWHVLRVEAVNEVTGKTLQQARPELVAELTRSKTAEALNQVQARIDEAITEGGTFDEIAADAKLQAQRLGPVTARGVNPDAPGVQPDAALTRVVEAGFAAEQGDAPQIVATAADGTFALVGLEQVIPAAPRPFAQVRADVQRQFLAERAQRAARTIATGILAKVNAGTPLTQAVGAAGVRLPAPERIQATRAQLASGRGQVPPPVELMFSMAAGKARLIAAPNNGGWFVVRVDAIKPGDASGDRRAVGAARTGLGGVIGNEYVEQFAAAVKRQIGVTKNDAAVARVRAELGGQAAPAN